MTSLEEGSINHTTLLGAPVWQRVHELKAGKVICLKLIISRPTAKLVKQATLASAKVKDLGCHWSVTSGCSS